MKLKKWMYVGGIFAGITLAGCGKDDNELNNTDKIL
jgi:hypothetical protein